ncbi:unnamed protein product [Amaranthus hypochondriacus]
MAIIHILCHHDSQPSSIDHALNFRFTIKLYRRHIIRLSNGKEFKTPPHLVQGYGVRSPSFDPFCPLCEFEFSDLLVHRYNFLEATIDCNMQKLCSFVNSLVEEIKILYKDEDPIDKVHNHSIDLYIRQEVTWGFKDDDFDNEIARKWVQNLLLISNDISPTCTMALFTSEKAKIQDENKNITCAICLDAFKDDITEDGKMIVELDCKHLFHKGCIGRWMLNNQSCPLCRIVLPVFDLDQYLDPITIKQPRMVLGIPFNVYDLNTCNTST